METIAEKAKDDQDFLWKYKDVRSMIPSQKYRENYDRIFNKQSSFNDRVSTSVDMSVSQD